MFVICWQWRTWFQSLDVLFQVDEVNLGWVFILSLHCSLPCLTPVGTPHLERKGSHSWEEECLWANDTLLFRLWNLNLVCPKMSSCFSTIQKMPLCCWRYRNKWHVGSGKSSLRVCICVPASVWWHKVFYSLCCRDTYYDQGNLYRKSSFELTVSEQGVHHRRETRQQAADMAAGS